MDPEALQRLNTLGRQDTLLLFIQTLAGMYYNWLHTDTIQRNNILKKRQVYVLLKFSWCEKSWLSANLM